MRFNDAIVGCVLVIFAIAEITYTRTFPSLFGQKYGPELFPIIIGIGLISTGLLLIVRGLHHKRCEGIGGRWLEAGEWSLQPPLKLNLLLVLFALLAYILFSEWFGFIPMSMIILSVLLYRFGSSIFASLLIAVATTATLQLLFAKILLVPLPAGLLTGWVY